MHATAVIAGWCECYGRCVKAVQQTRILLGVKQLDSTGWSLRVSPGTTHGTVERFVFQEARWLLPSADCQSYAAHGGLSFLRYPNARECFSAITRLKQTCMPSRLSMRLCTFHLPAVRPGRWEACHDGICLQARAFVARRRRSVLQKIPLNSWRCAANTSARVTGLKPFFLLVVSRKGDNVSYQA